MPPTGPRTTPLPELDLRRIRRFCEDKIPEALRDEIRVELELSGRSVTIVERRPSWDASFGPEWSRSPVARLRHIAADGVWILYWSDRHGRWHRYQGVGPTARVERLLTEIDKDPTGIFWG